jgi:hypothetical protein
MQTQLYVQYMIAGKKAFCFAEGFFITCNTDFYFQNYLKV